MEKTKQLLELTKEESDAVEKLAVRPRKAGEKCFFTFFALRGIRVDRVHPGLVVCTFKVPPRLTDRSGKLASGAIANLVDEVGSSVIYDEALPEPVSVDMSISYLSTAAVGDELEIISKLLGQKGRYSGTSVLIKNKTTGEIVAEGRHSLFSIRASKNNDDQNSASIIGGILVLQMKEKQFSGPQFQSQSSKSRTGQLSGALNKRNPESEVSYNYVKAAVKRVSGFFKSIFVGRKKVIADRSVIGARETNNSRREHSSYSTGSYGRSSSPFKSCGSYGSYGSSSSIPSELFASAGFSIEEIYKATDNFSAANVIGAGAFGTVYKGKLKDGSLVAVKRAKRNVHEKRLQTEFRNEIQTLSRIEHLNLVRLYGYLEQGDERIIIVEYVGNGNLREHLDGKRGAGLEIAERLDIAIDVAHAITYLHMYNDAPIIHRDIKASNILITEKLRAKVADFGFARLVAEDSNVTHISTQVKGTAGYLDPEYLRTYQLTEKSDVYSFGVLLVELMTGRHPIETKREIKERVTIRWALQKLKEGEAVIAMDPRLRRTSASTVAMESILKLARRCLDPLRPSRPSMKDCSEKLWGIRKEYRDRLLSSSCSALHSAEFPVQDAKKNLYVAFGIKEDEDLYSKFISA